jgi:hypothetical protein
MKQLLIEAAEHINAAINNGKEVFATWESFAVQIVSAKHQTRDDGEHLLGYDAGGKEYCIGGAKVLQEDTKDNLSITVFWNKGKPHFTAMISQPMKDKTESEIRQERENAVALLEQHGYEVVDTVFSTQYPQTPSPLQHLAKSLEAMAGVDLVYFLKGWERTRDCRIEHECCVLYGIVYQYEQ